MKKRHDFHKVVIGRAEELTLVDCHDNQVPAKVDTGAYRSAIHANKVELSQDGTTLSFVLMGGHPVYGNLAQSMTTSDFSIVTIQNSFGHEEDRYEVKLRVKLGPKVFSDRFTLANRSKKVFPVLIGRKLLNHRFLVDTSKTSVSRKELKQMLMTSIELEPQETIEEE